MHHALPMRLVALSGQLQNQRLGRELGRESGNR